MVSSGVVFHQVVSQDGWNGVVARQYGLIRGGLFIWIVCLSGASTVLHKPWNWLWVITHAVLCFVALVPVLQFWFYPARFCVSVIKFTCECWCFRECIGEAHEPCSCENWVKWQKKIADVKPENCKSRVTDLNTLLTDNSLCLGLCACLSVCTQTGAQTTATEHIINGMHTHACTTGVCTHSCTHTCIHTHTHTHACTCVHTHTHTHTHTHCSSTWMKMQIWFCICLKNLTWCSFVVLFSVCIASQWMARKRRLRWLPTACGWWPTLNSVPTANHQYKKMRAATIWNVQRYEKMSWLFFVVGLDKCYFDIFMTIQWNRKAGPCNKHIGTVLILSK